LHWACLSFAVGRCVFEFWFRVTTGFVVNVLWIQHVIGICWFWVLLSVMVCICEDDGVDWDEGGVQCQV